MNFLDVFLPYILPIALLLCSLIGFLLLFINVYDFVEHKETPSVMAWVIFLLIFFVLFGLFIHEFSNCRLKAEATSDWKEKAQNVQTAIILGFGYEGGTEGAIKPGKANIFLLQWAIDHTGANLMLVQEGVWAAASQVKSSRDIELRRMHGHAPGKYVNTLEAAYCALLTLEKLNFPNGKKVVVIAHDRQLKRALWDFIRIQKKNSQWRDIEIIVPGIPDTPYPEHPAKGQWHTGSKIRYTLAELFVARPRDYLSTVPDRTDVPLDLQSKAVIPGNVLSK